MPNFKFLKNVSHFGFKQSTQLLVLFVFGFVLYYGGRQFANTGGFLLTIEQMMRDVVSVPGSMDCKYIKFRQFDLAHNFSEVWESRFNNKEVSSFRKSNCLGSNFSTKTFIFQLKVTQCSTCLSRGIGCAVSDLLNFFLFISKLKEPRRFLIDSNGWNYGDWRNLFEFPQRCQSAHPARVSEDPVIPKFIQSPNGDTFIDCPDDCSFAVSGPQPQISSLFVAVSDMQLTLGVDHVFHQKYLASHLWLKPSLKVANYIEKVWKHLTENDGSYLSVHIRRGDKISSGEGLNFPVVLYYRALRRLCLTTAKNSCPRTVFLWGDDLTKLAEFKRLTENCFKIVMWMDLYKLPALEALKPFLPVKDHLQSRFDELEENERSKIAQMLVASLHLSAMADFVVCTLTSQLCRMVTVMRGGEVNQNGVLSLDQQKWHMA